MDETLNWQRTNNEREERNTFRDSRPAISFFKRRIEITPFENNYFSTNEKKYERGSLSRDVHDPSPKGINGGKW